MDVGQDRSSGRAARAAERFVSAGAGLAADAIRGEILQPRIALGNTARLLSASAEGIAALAGDSGTPFQELSNKLLVWNLFTWADRIGRVAAARRLPAFDSIWTLEGIGYRYGLRSDETRNLPERVLLPLHTGLGLALAEDALARPGTVRARLAEFINACDRNSRPEWSGIMFEALGIPAVNLHPDGSIVADIDRELAAMQGDRRDYFWHGAGRGAYFAPATFLPGLGMRAPAFRRLWAMASDASAQRNLAAGFAWATTLVNLRDPAVLMRAIERMPRYAGESAIMNGVGSALRFWTIVSPDDDYPAQLLGFDSRLKPASDRPIAALFRAEGDGSH